MSYCNIFSEKKNWLIIIIFLLLKFNTDPFWRGKIVFWTSIVSVVRKICPGVYTMNLELIVHVLNWKLKFPKKRVIWSSNFLRIKYQKIWSPKALPFLQMFVQFCITHLNLVKNQNLLAQPLKYLSVRFQVHKIKVE